LYSAIVGNAEALGGKFHMTQRKGMNK